MSPLEKSISPSSSSTKPRSSSRDIVVVVAIVVVLILAGFFFYKWYRQHYPRSASTLNEKERQALIDRGIEEAKDSPAIPPTTQQKLLEQSLNESSKSNVSGQDAGTLLQAQQADQ